MAIRPLVAIFSGALASTLACAPAPEEAESRREASGAEVAADRGDIAAMVNGRAILLDDLRRLSEQVDGGLPAEEALEALIDNTLLVEEARRRGYASWADVSDSRRNSLARELLQKKIGEEVNGETIEDNLRHFYKVKNSRFVHDRLREAIHVVALTGPEKLEADAAKKLIDEFHEHAKTASSPAEFKELGRKFKLDHGKTVDVDSIPPFSADNTKYVKEFVTAVFDLPEIGSVSTPVATKFGWHVIYLAAEHPARNLSFEQVRDTLTLKLLPKIREGEALEYIKEIRAKGNIYVHENVVSTELVGQK